MKNKKEELIVCLKSCLLVYIICFVIITIAGIIIYFPELREGFGKFFNCTPMTWEEAKSTLILDYLIAIPGSFIFGVFVYTAQK